MCSCEELPFSRGLLLPALLSIAREPAEADGGRTIRFGYLLLEACDSGLGM